MRASLEVLVKDEELAAAVLDGGDDVLVQPQGVLAVHVLHGDALPDGADHFPVLFGLTGQFQDGVVDFLHSQPATHVRRHASKLLATNSAFEIDNDLIAVLRSPLTTDCFKVFSAFGQSLQCLIYLIVANLYDFAFKLER